jgi:hypothetical protein
MALAISETIVSPARNRDANDPNGPLRSRGSCGPADRKSYFANTRYPTCSIAAGILATDISDRATWLRS